MTKEELFREKSENYMVCSKGDCPLHEQCLRWQVGQAASDKLLAVTSVNPMYRSVREGHCELFRSAQPVLMARGMTGIFTDDMPHGLIRAVREGMKKMACRTVFYEYRNGTRLMPPDMQEYIRNLFLQNGWQEEVHFDDYAEDYEWEDWKLSAPLTEE